MSLVRQALLEKINMKQVFRYGVTGVLTAFIYFLALVTAVEFADLPPVWGAAIAFCLPLPLNYFLHRNWSFESGVRHMRGVPSFLFTVLAGFCINAFVMYAGTAWMHFHYLPVQMVAIGIVIFWNFFIFSAFVFYHH